MTWVLVTTLYFRGFFILFGVFRVLEEDVLSTQGDELRRKVGKCDTGECEAKSR